MPTQFTDFEDIPLGRSPIAEVICQVRFPPILRITSESPAAFQDAVRRSFPVLEVVQESILQPAQLPPQAILPVYQFKSQDLRSLVALSVNFFAFSTQSYANWSQFCATVSLVADTVIGTYHPESAGRIGLRFVNKLTPQNTDRTTLSEIIDLLAPEFVSLYASSGWTDAERLEARIQVQDNGPALGIRLVADPEPFVVLDIDYFEQRENLDLDDLGERLDAYHRRIYNAFRWSLKRDAIDLFLPQGGAA